LIGKPEGERKIKRNI